MIGVSLEELPVLGIGDRGFLDVVIRQVDGALGRFVVKIGFAVAVFFGQPAGFVQGVPIRNSPAGMRIMPSASAWPRLEEGRQGSGASVGIGLDLIAAVQGVEHHPVGEGQAGQGAGGLGPQAGVLRL